jgi:hypothetical protein
MKSYVLISIFHVSGKQIGWDPMKIPEGRHSGRLQYRIPGTYAINDIIKKHGSAVDKED